jgi:uncharacterized protein (DUF924 family)
MKPADVITFWFAKDMGPDEWFFGKKKSLDVMVRKKFLKTYQCVSRGETAQWRATPKGRLAEIIVLDQFSRNMFRGTPQMYALDPLALALAQEAVRQGADKKLDKNERMFMYLPFEHSESKKVQKESVRLFKELRLKWLMPYVLDHKKIVDKFGRFPHRNAILGRTSTAAEKKFMRAHKGY